jgi:hypothetical protein
MGEPPSTSLDTGFDIHRANRLIARNAKVLMNLNALRNSPPLGKFENFASNRPFDHVAFIFARALTPRHAAIPSRSSECRNRREPLFARHSQQIITEATDTAPKYRRLDLFNQPSEMRIHSGRFLFRIGEDSRIELSFEREPRTLHARP